MRAAAIGAHGEAFRLLELYHMNDARFLELVRLARRRRDAMRSARSALYRAHTYREGAARDFALALVREQAHVARFYNRRLVANVRKWNQDADAIHALRFSRSSDLAASASSDRSIRLWRLSELAAAHPREEHDGAVSALAFSPDGSLCASGGSEGRIKLWEVASGRCIATLGIAAGTPVQSLAFTPDGHCVVSGSVGGHYRLWFIDSGEQVWVPVRHASPAAGWDQSPLSGPRP